MHGRSDCSSLHARVLLFVFSGAIWQVLTSKASSVGVVTGSSNENEADAVGGVAQAQKNSI